MGAALMPEWLTQYSAFGVFLAISAIGFLFLLISLVFGGLFEGLGDHDGDFGHDLGHGGPGFFSTRVISVFVTAFGGTGAVATHYGASVLTASGIGFASGFVFAYLIYLFARFLWGQQASSETRSMDVVGQTARVTVSIPAGGVGQVRCRVGEELMDRIARSRDGAAIPENTVVRIEEVLDEVVVVSKAP
jgi:membrane protein implicated in regulation of membrane protease activity